MDTGDIVERRGERYYFLGRRTGVINVGGKKVYPEEVEAVITGHPDISGGPQTTSNYSTPSVAVDPTNQMHAVAAYTVKLPDNSTVTQTASTTNGGTSWGSRNTLAKLFDPTTNQAFTFAVTASGGRAGERLRPGRQWGARFRRFLQSTTRFVGFAFDLKHPISFVGVGGGGGA